MSYNALMTQHLFPSNQIIQLTEVAAKEAVYHCHPSDKGLPSHSQMHAMGFGQFQLQGIPICSSFHRRLFNHN